VLRLMLALLRRVAIDLTPLRASRDFRLLFGGQMVSNLGTQAALVALPFQIFVLSHSPALVGLLGAFELGPMVVLALYGGAMADRVDRRLLVGVAQLGVIAAAGALAAAAASGRPPVLLVLILGGLLAGCATLNSVSGTAIVPNVLPPDRLRGGLALNYGVSQLAGIVGPAIGGLLIAGTSLATTYAVDAGSCVAMLAAVVVMSPQRPVHVEKHPPVLHSIAEGLRFVRGNRALAGSFAIDLVAMTFGMPRALFAVLSLTVYHAGASGAGLMYSAVALGGTVAVLTSGWLVHVRRLGLIVIGAVLAWGVGIALAGVVGSIGPALAFLAIAGAADGVSAVCRTAINQSVTPDVLRGRMSAVYILVVTSGPRFGDLESGSVAGLTSARISVLSGGLACVVGVGLIVLAFPALAAYGRDEIPNEPPEYVVEG
jgi:Transmembrane secretion effector